MARMWLGLFYAETARTLQWGGRFLASRRSMRIMDPEIQQAIDTLVARGDKEVQAFGSHVLRLLEAGHDVDPEDLIAFVHRGNES